MNALTKIDRLPQGIKIIGLLIAIEYLDGHRAVVCPAEFEQTDMAAFNFSNLVTVDLPVTVNLDKDGPS